MKSLVMMLLSLAILATGVANAAVFVSGSTGADGAFNPTASTTVVLPPDGVLNYTTVNIPAGVTVTFQRNTANTPVYMLATGDVTIAGVINVNGEVSSGTAVAQGGPGGFAGGASAMMAGVPGSRGQGPGGGGTSSTSFAGGAGHSTAGAGATLGGSPYGYFSLQSLIGGSGGGGGAYIPGNNCYACSYGGGGAGAILIASSTTINVTGSIQANGGAAYRALSGSYYYGNGGGGSGGSIRLAANIITGNGTIIANGGAGGQNSNSTGYAGAAGYIRLEANVFNRQNVTTPMYSFGNPGPVFPPAMPGLTIASIAGVTTPAAPTGNFTVPDITLPYTTTNPVEVVVNASNIPTGTSVKIRIIPQNGTPTSVDATLSGTEQSSTASANITIPTSGSAVIMAEVTYTVTAMSYGGEDIDKVHVASQVGSAPTITYITKSGKKITADMLVAMR